MARLLRIGGDMVRVPVVKLLKDVKEVVFGQQSGDVQGQRTVDHAYVLYKSIVLTVLAVRHLDRDFYGKISYL
jgi:hypothetical protein